MKKGHINIEVKARCSDFTQIRRVLRSHHAKYTGCDHQIDTYFKVKRGRLKIREGNIENNLIFYNRSDKKGIKQSNIILMKNIAQSPLKEIFNKALGVLVVVDKQRNIFFIGNIKFHLDTVKYLGSFVEIEAIDYLNKIGKKKLTQQVNMYLKLFGIQKKDMISKSYSDLLLKN